MFMDQKNGLNTFSMTTEDKKRLIAMASDMISELEQAAHGGTLPDVHLLLNHLSIGTSSGPGSRWILQQLRSHEMA